jgi:hypothetical protein
MGKKLHIGVLPDGTDAGFTPHIDGQTTGSNAVLARHYTLERLGHFVDVWSDDDRTTRSECSCGAMHGPFHSADSWQLVWGAHFTEANAARDGLIDDTLRAGGVAP